MRNYNKYNNNKPTKFTIDMLVKYLEIRKQRYELHNEILTHKVTKNNEKISNFNIKNDETDKYNQFFHQLYESIQNK